MLENSLLLNLSRRTLSLNKGEPSVGSRYDEKYADDTVQNFLRIQVLFLQHDHFTFSIGKLLRVNDPCFRLHEIVCMCYVRKSHHATLFILYPKNFCCTSGSSDVEVCIPELTRTVSLRFCRGYIHLISRPGTEYFHKNLLPR